LLSMSQMLLPLLSLRSRSNPLVPPTRSKSARLTSGVSSSGPMLRSQRPANACSDFDRLSPSSRSGNGFSSTDGGRGAAPGGGPGRGGTPSGGGMGFVPGGSALPGGGGTGAPVMGSFGTRGGGAILLPGGVPGGGPGRGGAPT